MNSKNKKYISFFQETNSYGIVTTAPSREEASLKAAKKLKDKVSEKMYVSRMPVTHVQTEEWTPDVEIESGIHEGRDVKYTIQPNEDFVDAVSKHCQKLPEDLKDEDFEKFFMDSTKEFIEKGTEWVERKTSEKIAELEGK